MNLLIIINVCAEIILNIHYPLGDADIRLGAVEPEHTVDLYAGLCARTDLQQSGNRQDEAENPRLPLPTEHGPLCRSRQTRRKSI